MLNHFFLNRKKIPVPVPIRNLVDAIKWIETCLLSDDKAITKIELDGVLVEDLERPKLLNSKSRLFVQVDSPLELSVQTIDALRNLINLINKDLKSFAVAAWQSKPQEKPGFVGDILEDLDLANDMLEHIILLLNGRFDAAALGGFVEPLHRVSSQLQLAVSQSDWKAVAKILLRDLEKLLLNLGQTLPSIQAGVFAYQAEQPQIRELG